MIKIWSYCLCAACYVACVILMLHWIMVFCYCGVWGWVGGIARYWCCTGSWCFVIVVFGGGWVVLLGTDAALDHGVLLLWCWGWGGGIARYWCCTGSWCFVIVVFGGGWVVLLGTDAALDHGVLLLWCWGWGGGIARYWCCTGSWCFVIVVLGVVGILLGTLCHVSCVILMPCWIRWFCCLDVACVSCDSDALLDQVILLSRCSLCELWFWCLAGSGDFVV